MKRAYVAGALSDPNVCTYLTNCSRMMDVAEIVRRLGVSVYIPCIDLQMGLKFGYYEYDDYFNNSHRGWTSQIC